MGKLLRVANALLPAVDDIAFSVEVTPESFVCVNEWPTTSQKYYYQILQMIIKRSLTNVAYE